MILEKSVFLSNDYVNNLLCLGKWTKHGSHLNQWLEECEDVPDYYQGGDIDTLKKDEGFLAFFKDYLSARFDYAMRFLNADLSGSGDLVLNRAILVDKDFMGLLVVGEAFDFGRYWSTQHTIPYGAEPDTEKHSLFVVGNVKRDQIDILETMRSRMDYIHGDYEMEIQTINGEKVELLSFD